MATDRLPGNAADAGGDRLGRAKKIAEQHHSGMARQLGRRRQAVARIEPAEIIGQPIKPSTAHAARPADQPHPFPAAQQQGGQRQQQKIGAFPLLGRNQLGMPQHRRRGIAPQADGLGGLPLHFAHDQVVAHRRFAPVDAAGFIAVHVGPILPDTVAWADAAATMHALPDRGGNAIGCHLQGRKPRTKRFGSTGAQPRRSTSRAIISDKVTPRARAS